MTVRKQLSIHGRDKNGVQDKERYNLNPRYSEQSNSPRAVRRREKKKGK